MFRPEQELKGFAKVQLNAGEEKQVTIPLNARSFAVWSIAENRWVIEPGTYQLRIGASSRDIRLTARVKKDGTEPVNPYCSAAFAPYYEARVHNISDESFAALLGREIPTAFWDRSAPIGFNDTIAQGAYLKGGIGKLIFDLIDMSRRALLAFGMKDKANGIMFILNMPWRNVARMSGVLTDQQIKALLKLINRRR